MIIIVSGSVLAFKAKLMADGMADKEALDAAIRLTLGIGVVAGVIQIIFGLARAGVLADVFPISAIHGLLASIGVIIILKQAYPMLGIGNDQVPKGAPINLLIEFPHAIRGTIPEIAAIGIPSLIILFALTFVTSKTLKRMPGPVLVLLYAIPMGYVLNIHDSFLVNIPNVLGEPEQAFARPSFDGVLTGIGVQFIVLFALIGSLETLLAGKAIDRLDPWKRKTNFNRDLFAVGVANTVVSCIGGSPMISEIVRSRANIDNGARSRFANFFHGMFLLLAVLFLAGAIHRIPVAALGAMLVFTGYRLAHPREFTRSFMIGVEQLLIFVTTIVVVLFTDLLIGIAAGVGVKLLALLYWRVWPMQWFRLDSTTEKQSEDVAIIHVSGPIVFLNWIRLNARIAALETKHVIVDVSKTTFIDHTSIEKFHDLRNEFKNEGRFLEVKHLETMKAVSSHNLAARKASGVVRPRQG